MTKIFHFLDSDGEMEVENDDVKAVDEDRDSGKGDTLAKNDEVDNQKK